MARQQSESRPESRQQSRQLGSQSLEPRRQNQLQRETWPTFTPFSMMRRMVEDMDRIFEGFGGTRSNSAFETFLPSVDLFERDGKVIVRADLPGMSKDDVRVEMTDDAILIEGERKYEHEQNEQGVYRSERNYGRFYREIPLPEGVKT
jgi:HSP20 family protein